MPVYGLSAFTRICISKKTENLCSAKWWLPVAHFERAKDTGAEASDYCEKDEICNEFGQLTVTERKVTTFRDAYSA